MLYWDNEDLSPKARLLINASNPVPAPECPKRKHQNDVSSRRSCNEIYFPNDTRTKTKLNYKKLKAPVFQLQLPLEKKKGGLIPEPIGNAGKNVLPAATEYGGYAVAQLVEATNRKVAGSIPDVVIGIFH